MINVESKKCQSKKCKNIALYGFLNKMIKFCSPIIPNIDFDFTKHILYNTHLGIRLTEGHSINKKKGLIFLKDYFSYIILIYPLFILFNKKII